MKNDKEVVLVVLVQVEGNVAQATKAFSKSPTQAYRDNFDAIFGSKEQKSLN